MCSTGCFHGYGNPVRNVDPNGHEPCDSVNRICTGTASLSQLRQEWEGTGYTNQVSFATVVSGKYNYQRYQEDPTLYVEDYKVEQGHLAGNANLASATSQNATIYASYTGQARPLLLVDPAYAQQELDSAATLSSLDYDSPLHLDVINFFGAILGVTEEGGGLPLRGKVATEAANQLGYSRRIPAQRVETFNSHGQPAFYDRKSKTYITPDVDGHNGGVWKMFDRKGNRLGTYDADLNWIGD